jgi:pyridoxal phosphate enzyme (YggS family)
MSIAERLAELRGAIASACSAAGRAPSEVTLVAVSKTVPLERCQEALAAGQDVFGENYAQELRDKAAGLPSARWHFVGPLQRNKVKYVVGIAELIHTVDSPKLAEEIAARAAKLGIEQRCLVQVNIGSEPQKSGCAKAELSGLLAAIKALPALRCEGLMCIPPDERPARPYFDELAGLARVHGLRELSMGMSSDFGDAIAAGATLVRIGSAIFGERITSARR